MAFSSLELFGDFPCPEAALRRCPEALAVYQRLRRSGAGVIYIENIEWIHYKSNGGPDSIGTSLVVCPGVDEQLPLLPRKPWSPLEGGIKLELSQKPVSEKTSRVPQIVPDAVTATPKAVEVQLSFHRNI